MMKNYQYMLLLFWVIIVHYKAEQQKFVIYTTVPLLHKISNGTLLMFAQRTKSTYAAGIVPFESQQN